MKGNITMKKSVLGIILTAPLLLGCLFFYIIPIALTLVYSFSRGSGASMSFVGLDNYIGLMNNENFGRAFGNTMRFLSVGLPLIMLFSYLVALLFQKEAKKHKLLKTVFFLPYVMPIVGTVIIGEALFGEGGKANDLLHLINISSINWLDGPQAFWVAILLYVWKNMGYGIILLLAGLVTIPAEQYESAELDGASSLQLFCFITTPQMWYSVFIALAFSVINSFKCFREIFLIGGQHPTPDIYMLQHFINNGFENLNYSRLSAASIFLLLTLLIFFLALYVFAKRKEV